MDPDFILDVARQTFFTTAIILAPLLGAGMLVGLTVAILQTMTSIHEQTMTMVPKMAAVGTTLLLLLPWMVRHLIEFTESLIGNLAQHLG